MSSPQPPSAKPPLRKLSIVSPARDEEAVIASMVEKLEVELRLQDIEHEIIVVDDGSKDSTWKLLQDLTTRVPTLRPIQNNGAHGFGRAIVFGLDHMVGDAVVIMMADESDDPRDAVAYWRELQKGRDCVFGSRFIPGGGVIAYPIGPK